MADKSTCLTHEAEFGDFPPVNLLNTLISSFPSEWRGIFAALNSEFSPVQAARFWLQKKLSSNRLSDIPPNWTDFVNHLASDFPVVLDNRLFFKPKLLLLPLNMQRNTLAFILQQSNVLPSESLEKLIVSLEEIKELKDWRAAYVNILQSKVNDLKKVQREKLNRSDQGDREDINFFYLNCITEESKSRFDELIKKNQMAESSRSIPWLSQQQVHEIRKSNKSWSENHPALHRDCKVIDQDNVDMLDVTNICTDDVDSQFDTKLLETCLEAPHDFYDNDIEINDTNESPEHCTDIIAKDPHLKVPPPPEHWNMEAEDVPELLITDQEATAESKLYHALQPNISALKNFLTSLEVKEEDNYSSYELDVFSTCSSLEVEYICNQLHIKGLQEPTAIFLCTKFVDLKAEPSFSNACVFASQCLLPKIQELKQVASRGLLMAVTLFSKKHSRAFCDGVVVKLIQESDLNTPQVDIIGKIVKECFTEDTRIHLMELTFAIRTDSQGHPFTWSENTVSVVQTMVDLKLEFSGNFFGVFAGVLELQSCHLSKSLKFAKMLLAVIRTYGKLVSAHYGTFLHILEVNGTFLKKAGLAALQKAEKQ